MILISLTCSLATIPAIVLSSNSERVAQNKLQKWKNGGVMLECDGIGQLGLGLTNSPQGGEEPQNVQSCPISLCT